MAVSETKRLRDSIARSLKSFSNPSVAEHTRRWVKNPDFKSWGIGTEDFMNAVAKYKPEITRMPVRMRLDLARLLVDPGIHELAWFGNIIVSYSLKEIGRIDLNFLSDYPLNFHSWAITDDFCINIVQPLLRRFPAEVLRIAARWNRSRNVWMKRASVVSFTRRVGASGEYTETVLRFCDRLIRDEEDTVRKGIGWALKDNMRGNKSTVMRYVRGLRRKGVSSVITLYAMRDLKGVQRKRLLKVGPAKG